MKKRHLLIGGLLVLGVSASAIAFAACDNTVPEEKVPQITETVRYTDKTNPYAELGWQQFTDIDDWADKQENADIYYQFEGSYSEAYQGNYSRTFLYMNCYEDGSLHATYGSENYYGYWTNVDKRGNESLVLHILNFNGNEYNNGIYESVCDVKADEYYEYASTVIWDPGWGTRTVFINGYHYSPVKSLTVTTSDKNTDFILNDSFSTKGLVVTVNRENGKSIAIDEESFGKSDCRVQFSGFDGKEEGEQDIKVKYIYTDIETTYKVSVMGITGIEVDASEGKTDYHVGDSLDKNGLSIIATRKDGKKVSVAANSNRCQFEGFDAKEAVEKQTITIKLDGEYEASYDIKVFAIKSLAIDASEVKKEYYVGDNIDTTNLKISATFEDGVTDEIEVRRCKIDFKADSAAESKTVTISFQGLEKTYDVKVVAPEFTGNGKYGSETVEVKIKITTDEQCEVKFKGKTVTANYGKMTVNNSEIYTLSLPNDAAPDADFETLHKQYVLDKEDFSLSMTSVYKIPDQGGDRQTHEPMPGIGGNSELRFIFIDEEKGEATITYKYWFAGQTDTFVCKYTIENDILTFTECITSSVGGNNSQYGNLHKTWKLNADGSATKYTPPTAE